MRPTPINGAPPGARTTRPPPRSHRGAAPEEQRGTTKSPPPPRLPPLPPRPADRRRPARGTAAPQPPPPGPGGDPPPRGPRHPGSSATVAVRAAVHRVPPVCRPPIPAEPAAGRQPRAGAGGHPVGHTRTAGRGRETVQCGGRGNDEANRLGARVGRAERRTAAEQPSRPPPRWAPKAEPPRRSGAPTPPPQTHQRPATPRLAPGAATQPRQSKQQGGIRGATPPAMRGGPGPGATAQPPR